MRTNTTIGWQTTIRLHHIAHMRCAARNAQLHRAMGFPVILLTTVVGSTVFATMGKSPDPMVVIATGLFSLLAAVLAALQTFLNYSTLAEKHKIAATSYGMLRREIEQFIDDPDASPVILREFSEGFRARWAQVDQESPTIPQSIHEKAQAQLLQFLSEESARLPAISSTQDQVPMPLPQPTGTATHQTTSSNPSLLLVRGLPGSGKTSMAKSLQGFVHLEADQFFERDGEFEFDRSKLAEAHAWCLQQTKEELDAGRSVVVSNTFTRNVEMLPYFQLGYPTIVMEATGQWKSVHGVPDDVVELMRQKWEKLSIEVVR